MENMTYNFPEALELRYQILIQTKHDFSRKITSVEQQKLETLYAQLSDAWNRNLTLPLKMKLEEELKAQAAFKVEDEEKWKAIIEKKEIELKEKSKRLKIEESNYAEKKTQKGTNLTQMKSNLGSKELQERLNLQKIEEELKSEQMTQEALRKELDKKSLEWKEISDLLEKKKAPYQESLQALRQKNESILNPLRKTLKEKSSIWKTKSQGMEEILIEKEEQLKIDTINVKEKLLTKLAEEISKETPKLPEPYRGFFIDFSYLLTGEKLEKMKSELKKRQENLRIKLTKAGIKYEDYISQFDRQYPKARR